MNRGWVMAGRAALICGLMPSCDVAAAGVARELAVYAAQMSQTAQAMQATAAAVRSSASSVSFAAPPALPPGGRYLSAGAQLQVQGQAMTGWIFEAPGDIQEIAKWLSSQLPVLRDLLVAPGLVVLSGMDAAFHWSARLMDGGAGWTQGTLSRLPLEQPASDVSAAARWRPEGARLHFDVRWREARHVGVQQVWTHGAVPAELRPRLRAALQRDGWRASEPDAALPGRWSKASARLSIVVVAYRAGSGIVTVLDSEE